MSTEQPRPLQGYRESQETKKDAPIDPKRFQEELSKVQESGESQQRSKRNLKRSEEEGEDEETAKKELIQASGALFAMFMKSSLSQNLLTPKTPQNIRGSQAPTTSSQFTIETDQGPSKPPLPPNLGQEPFIATGAPEQAPPTLASTQQPPQPSDAAPQQVSISEPQITTPLQPPIVELGAQQTESQPTERAPSQQVSAPERVEKKEVEDLSPYAKKGKTKGQIAKEKQEKTPQVRLEKGPSAKPASSEEKGKEPEKKKEGPTLIKETPKTPLGVKALEPEKEKPSEKLFLGQTQMAEEKGAEKQQAAPAIPLQVAPFSKESAKQEKEGKEVESLEKGLSIKTQTGSSEQEKKEKEEEKEAPSIEPTPFVQPVFNLPPPQGEAPVYATLPPQVYELFEKMVGVMTIEHMKGVTTTTVTINMKNSVLDGAEIILDHYSTAPNSFNVTIAASPQGQQLLDANLEKLIASFQSSKLSFEVNLRRPVLLESYQAVRRKEKVGEEGSEDQEQQK